MFRDLHEAYMQSLSFLQFLGFICVVIHKYSLVQVLALDFGFMQIMVAL